MSSCRCGSDLRLIHLHLSHFRSHRSAELGFDGRPVAIHGPNGAGKTNLIETISLLSPGRGLRGAASEDLARAPDRIGWKVKAILDSPDGSHEVASWSEGPGRQVTIDGKPASQTALGRVARVLWLTPAMDRLWMEAAGERRRFLDRVTLSLLPEQGELVLGYDRALRERNRLLRDGSRDRGWYEALEVTMADFGARVIANRERALGRLAATPEDTGFPRAELTIEAEGPRDRDGLQAMLRDRGRDFAAGRTLQGPHRDDLGAVLATKGVAARLCSTGEQKALLISLILANARAVAADFGGAPILLLDEVAAHLDAGRRGALYEALHGLGGQVFLTGTGPELFEGLGGQRLEVLEQAGESLVRPGLDIL